MIAIFTYKMLAILFSFLYISSAEGTAILHSIGNNFQKIPRKRNRANSFCIQMETVSDTVL